MKDRYTMTRRCCYIGSLVQALVLNVTPLFFVTLREQFSISFEQIGRLVFITFFVQMCVDFLAVYVVDKLGYRLCMVLAQTCAAAGLILFGILPNVLPQPYVGMVLAVLVYSVGAGLAEVMISPVVDAIPSDQKAASMTKLHAFYPIGQVVTIIGTTVAVTLFGTQNWWWILPAWAIVPLINLVFALRVPFPPMLKETEKMPIFHLLKEPYFWLMLLLMLCGGASEMAVSQWASLFAEEGLGISKLWGDLLGPCLFAVCMGGGRLLYGIRGSRIPMQTLLRICGFATVGCYLLAVFATLPIFALLGCALCGFATSLMWPGVLSISSERFPGGGTVLFAFLALGGDIGCSLGPWLTGVVADCSSYGLKGGLLTAMVFPIMLVAILMLTKTKKAVKE